MPLNPEYDVPMEQRIIVLAILYCAALFVFLGFLAVSFGILVPFNGALVRFRADYTKKGVQLDLSEGEDSHTDNAAYSYFGMLARVKRIEGWAGLYKGLMPMLLSSMPFSALTFLVAGLPPIAGVYGVGPRNSVVSVAYSTAMIFISIPCTILIYRSITTPHKLPYFGLKKSLRILLTQQERSRPWVLYLTPGLLVSEILQVALVMGTKEVHRFVVISLNQLPLESRTTTIITVILCFLTAALSTLVLTPLQVISTRVAVQPNRGSPSLALASGETTESINPEANVILDEGIEFSALDSEDVVILRDGQGVEPYLGLIDCGKKIMKEEGWAVLYRAWWITALGAIAASFA